MNPVTSSRRPTDDHPVSFNDLVELSNSLRIIASEKNRIVDKFVTIAEICKIYEKLLRSDDARPRLVAQGKPIAALIADCVDSESDFSTYLKSLASPSVESHYHLFYVTLFSAAISKEINWSSRRTLESLVLAALLHDIGEDILKINTFPGDITQWTREQKEIYKQHPREGFLYLDGFAEIPEPVKQIVYQHHEYANGTGFPEGLSSSKIYPLAKVLTLSNEFSHCLETEDLRPIDGLKKFLSDFESIDKFDPDLVKGLIKVFIRSGKKG